MNGKPPTADELLANIEREIERVKGAGYERPRLVFGVGFYEKHIRPDPAAFWRRWSDAGGELPLGVDFARTSTPNPQGDHPMSFSVHFVGKPDAIKRALTAASDNLTGQSKAELEAIKPGIEAVLDANMPGQVLRVRAEGHSYTADGVRTAAQCAVTVELLGGFVE